MGPKLLRVCCGSLVIMVLEGGSFLLTYFHSCLLFRQFKLMSFSVVEEQSWISIRGILQQACTRKHTFIQRPRTWFESLRKFSRRGTRTIPQAPLQFLYLTQFNPAIPHPYVTLDPLPLHNNPEPLKTTPQCSTIRPLTCPV